MSIVDIYLNDNKQTLQDKLMKLEDLHLKLKADKEIFEELTSNTKNYDKIVENYTYAINKLDINIQVINNSIQYLNNI